MGIQIYNTLGHKKVPFIPINDKEVKMYVCGPTVYDLLHIGNFRGAICFNLVRHWLEHRNYRVTLVYNYTDVDDKIIKRANEKGVKPIEISEKYITEFQKDFDRLGLKRHDQNPKVTEYMPQIIEFVENLIKKEKAYVIDGEVFYAVDSYEDYGKLSGKKLDELEAGQRVEVDKRKKNPADFVLWKPSKEGEPSWKSPWGEGRPGWHIECSAMIQSILGETIDIHGGGIDLIFPHHENEIAQGEGCTGHTYCNYWMHNNFINIKDQKMSKSLGNVITARAFMDQYHPEILKYTFLSVHYRSMLTVDDEKLEQVMAALSRIYLALETAEQIVKATSAEQGQLDGAYRKILEATDKKIEKALDDDFNSATFLSQFFEAVRAFNALKYKNKKWNDNHGATAKYFLDWVHKYGKMAALFQERPSEFLERLNDIGLKKRGLDRKQVEELVLKRSHARDAKDWAESDKIRDELTKLGVELHDGSTRAWSVNF